MKFLALTGKKVYTLTSICGKEFVSCRKNEDKDILEDKMKKVIKKSAIAALAGVMAAGMLSGCGKEETLDGTAVVANVNGEEVSMGELSLRVRQVQAQITELYISFLGSAEGIWSQEVDTETGETYGEQTVKECLEQLELMYVMKEKAADYGIEITEEEQEAMKTAAAQFMEDNSEETLAELAVSEADVTAYLELETYYQKVYEAVIADVDTEVADTEAQQSSFSYLNVDTTDMTEEEVTAAKEQLQEVLTQMQENEEADLTAVANEVDETYSVLTGSYTTNAWEEETAYPTEILEVLSEMEDGDVCGEIIETEADGLYIVVMDAVFDEEATESKKDSIIYEREEALFTETTEQWLSEAEITVDEKVLAGLELKDNHQFVYAQTEVAEDELIEDDMEVSEEEIIDDEMEEIDEEDVSMEDGEEIEGAEEIDGEELMEVTDDDMDSEE